MNLALDIFNYIFVAILIGVSATWIFLIRSMFRTFQETPFLDKFKKKEHCPFCRSHDPLAKPPILLRMPKKKKTFAKLAAFGY